MDEAGIYARESSYLDRYVQVGIAQGRVISLSFPKNRPQDAVETHDVLDQIEAYLNGATNNFSDVPVALTMQTNHRDVLEAVREIPYGETYSIEQLTGLVSGRDSEDEPDRTVVREALEANPVPLLVPDHRVRDGPSGAPPAVEQKLRSLEGLS